jgi:NhaP-type Na+/H+ or K+/H+ antiporter
MLLLVRFGAVSLATIRVKDLEKERPIMSVMLTRGLAAAVLATLPFQYVEVDFYFKDLSPIYINIAVLVILTTAIMATMGIPLLRNRRKAKEQPQDVLKISNFT